MTEDLSSPCFHCGVETWPWEMYMVTDEVWCEAGSVQSFLCIGCLEERLDRGLVPEDFPALGLNDDHETDSVRLRVRKGSGRNVQGLYSIAAAAVLDVGADIEATAATLELDAGMLATVVDQERFSRAALAEIEESE